MNRASFAAALLSVGASASWVLGKCPEIKIKTDLDLARYSGTWYETRKDFLNVFEIGASCTTANYSLNDDGSVTVYNRAYTPFAFGYYDVLGKGVESEVTGPGSLVVSFHSEPDSSRPGNYNVLDTDYDTYALFFSCSEKTNFGIEYANFSFSILSRERTLSDDLRAELAEKTKAILPSYDYDSNVVDTKQEGDCEYSPEPSTQFL
mmetsp:Transcript_27282/g.33927  ORF Transcript_27282/g.33927 Transcript_27282/m.33927 type:complete len:206 (+) Transcript_27282:90-707(+)